MLQRLFAVVAFVVPFAVYAASGRRTVMEWDTGELQTVPYILGIAHPTGFSTFTLAGFAFTHLFAVDTVAWRMSVLCALATACACLLLYLALTDEEIAPPIALAATALFAFGEVVWRDATRAEVHTFVVATCALVILLALRWNRTGSPPVLIATAAALGFAAATHGLALLLVPGVAILVLARRADLTQRLVALALLALVAGASPILYLPIRSAVVTAERKDPTLQLGFPPGKPFWDYNHPSSPAGLRTVLLGSEFDTGDGLAAIVDPAVYAQLQRRYWPWLGSAFGPGAVIVAAIGFVAFVRRRPAAAIGVALAGFLGVPFALGYGAESVVERYFATSFWVVGFFAALGADALAAPFRESPETRRLTVLGASVLLAIFAVQTFRANQGLFGTRAAHGETSYVDRVIAQTRDGSVLVAMWNDATPLAYAAYVERRLGTRIVDTAWPQDDVKRFPGWLREGRPVYVVSDFDLHLPPELKRILISSGVPAIWKIEFAS